MKRLIFLLSLACFAFSLKAQQTINVDPELKFDQRFSKCERKWVVLARRDTDKTYTYGFIYL